MIKFFEKFNIRNLSSEVRDPLSINMKKAKKKSTCDYFDRHLNNFFRLYHTREMSTQDRLLAQARSLSQYLDLVAVTVNSEQQHEKIILK